LTREPLQASASNVLGIAGCDYAKSLSHSATAAAP
jgi:hypothetical protein